METEVNHNRIRVEFQQHLGYFIKQLPFFVCLFVFIKRSWHVTEVLWRLKVSIGCVIM